MHQLLTRGLFAAACATPAAAQPLIFTWSGTGDATLNANARTDAELSISLTVDPAPGPASFSSFTDDQFGTNNFAHWDATDIAFTIDGTAFTTDASTTATLLQTEQILDDGRRGQSVAFIGLEQRGSSIDAAVQFRIFQFMEGEPGLFDAAGSFEGVTFGPSPVNHLLQSIAPITAADGTIITMSGGVLDTLTITKVPAPSAAAPLAIAGLLSARRRRTHR